VPDLLLVVPIIGYRSAVALDSEEKRAAFQQGKRDAATDRRGASWTQDDRQESESWRSDRWQAYMLGRKAGAPAQAPPSWPVEGMLLALEALVDSVAARRPSPEQIALLPVSLSGMWLLQRLRQIAERHRARQLHVTTLSAPRARLDAAPWWLVAVNLVRARYWRHRGFKLDAQPSWQTSLARNIIKAVNRRRAWDAALQREPPAH
jgi:hypothetical protein